MLAAIGANAAGLTIAVILYLTMKRVGKMKKPWAKKLVPFLAFASGAVLASTVLGVWAANLGSMFGPAIAIMLGGLAFLMCIYIVADLVDGEMNSKWTGVGLVVLPLVGMAGAGLVPDFLVNINTNTGGAIVGALGPWIGA